jgi:hypothetical protein
MNWVKNQEKMKNRLNETMFKTIRFILMRTNIAQTIALILDALLN